MTAAPDFIAELVRAANQVGKLSPVERRRLLHRAVSTIQGLRNVLAATDKIVPMERGVSKDLQHMSSILMDIPDVIVADALLEGAHEIRRLRILANTQEG